MNEAPPTNQGPQKRPISLFGALMIWAVVVVGLLSIFPGRFILAAANTIYQADEGFKRARRTIDPEELRRWALQEIAKHSSNHEIPASEIPGYIANLYSRRPEEAVRGQSTVAIVWGGGFFHWVIEIGDTNFSRPFVSDNPEYFYNFEWTNGIYYTREARWKLW